MTPEGTGIFTFEGIVVDVRRQEAARNGERIDLEPKAVRVLSYLVANCNRVVTKEELITGIWAGTFVTDNALTRVIAQIRKQLGDNARSPRFIETVATTGYRFIADVVEEPAAAASAQNPRPVSGQPPRWRIAAAVAAAFTIGAGAWSLHDLGKVDMPHLAGLQQITSSAAADLWPTFAPDGSQIAFSSNRTGSFEIYTRSLAPGSAERQITSDGGHNIEPAWSPNGQEIAYASEKRGGVAVIPVSGGATRYLTDTGSDPHWSPDGRTLAYSAGSVGKINLWLVAVNGALPRALTRSGTPPGDHERPKWLADGRHVVFSAFAPNKGQPWIVDTMTGQLQRIQVAADSVLFPLFSANQRFLFFSTPGARGVATPLDPVGVWRARIDSHWRAEKPELLIPSGGPLPEDLAVTADGSRIAISQVRRENALWSLPLNRSGLNAGEPRLLIHDASLGIGQPAFSADGSKLAYASIRQGGDWTIFAADADGSSPYPVTSAGQSNGSISWIGNESLAYLGNRQGKTEFWVAPLHGPPKRMDLKLDVGPYAFARVSRQGDTLVAHSGNRSVGIKLVLINLATGQSRDLTPQGRTFVFPSWSPDGRWIAAVERLDPKTDNRVVINAATGAIQNLMDAPGGPTFFHANWAPDNDRIVFASQRDGVSNIYWVSRSSGQVQQLTHFDSQSETARGPAWSPKGDQIVFVHDEMAANIYVGELR